MLRNTWKYFMQSYLGGILNGHKCILQQNNDDEQNNLKEQEILEVLI